MGARIWIHREHRREESMSDYELQVALVPEQWTTYSVSANLFSNDKLRRQVSIHPERPHITIQLRGKGMSASSYPLEPTRAVVAGLSLPRADAAHLAVALLRLCRRCKEPRFGRVRS